MDRYEYAEEVCKYINKHGYHTEITRNARNNGAYVAVTVRRSPEDKVAPVFKIGDESDDPVIFAQRILDTVPAKIDTKILTDIMTDKEEVLKRCTYILVNSELNRVKETLVRRPINQTLELHYKVDISDVLDGARITLERKHIENLKIADDELYVRAYANTMEKYPYTLQTIGEAIGCDVLPEVPKMYVLTNSAKIYGAGVALYSGMREVLENAVGGETIMIPSSIHEWIVIPAILGERKTITTMIRDVNSSVLSREDILSDRPYELIADGVLFEV